MPSTIAKKSSGKKSAHKKIALGATRRPVSQAKLVPVEIVEQTLRRWGPNVLTVREEQIFRALGAIKQ